MFDRARFAVQHQQPRRPARDRVLRNQLIRQRKVEI
jgi:hypothetical protein